MKQLVLADERKFRILLVLLGGAGAVLVYVATALRGVGLSVDAVSYVSAARSLLAGSGYTTFAGLPYTVFPPLYPTLLAGLGGLGMDVIEAARFLNAVCAGGIIFLSGLLFTRLLESRLLALIGVAAVLLAVPLYESYVMAHSEPLYFLLILLGLLLLLNYLREPRALTLWALAATAALACAQKYAGLGVVLSFGLVLLVGVPGLSLRRRLRSAVLFGFVSILPLGLWFVRNHFVSQTTTGPRPESHVTLPHVLAAMGETLSAWYVPRGVPYAPRVLAFVLLFLLAVGASVVAFRTVANAAAERRRNYMVVGLLVLGYTGFMVVTSLVTWIDDLGSRLIGPIFVPLLLLIVAGLENLARVVAADASARRIMHGILVGALALWLVYPLGWTYHRIGQWRSEGYKDMLAPKWSASPTLNWVRTQLPAAEILSNRPEVFYAQLGRQARKSPTVLNPQALPTRAADPGRELYLVWFDEGGSPQCISVTALASQAPLQEVARFEDGTIYRIGGGPGNAPSPGTAL